jgi:serine protease
MKRGAAAGLAFTLLFCLVALMASPARSLGGDPHTQSAARNLASADEAEFLKGQVLVKFHDGISDNTMLEIQNAIGTGTISIHRMGVRKISVPEGMTEQQLVDLLNLDPRVDYAELNSVCHAFTTPNDPEYSFQWHFPAVNAPSAWEISAGSGIVVAILDTGIAYEDYPIPPHELATVREGITNYYRAPDFGGTNFVAGYDFVNNDDHPNDNSSHGTHVAGTVAQTTNNRLGTAGLAFDCSLMPVKVLDYQGSGAAAELADGIYWAVDNGAEVINMSLGWFPGYDPGATVHDAVQYAYNHDVVMVASSGNWGTGTIAFPAAYPEVIAVGATKYDNGITDYSQYGPEQEVMAPGGDIYLDENMDGEVDGVLQQTFVGHSFGPPEVLADPTDFDYYFYDGTSMAAPHVAALAALMIANGQTGVENIRSILHATATDLGEPGWDEHYGYGLIDAYAALTYSGSGSGVGDRGDEPGSPDKGQALDAGQNNPNPFSISTRFDIYMERAGSVTVRIFSIRGQEIRTLASGYMDAGEHALAWDGMNDRGDPVPSGVYLYQVQTVEHTVAHKMVLAR